MELSHSLVSTVSKPNFILSTDNFLSEDPAPEWRTSCLNPANRINRLDESSSHWRIDGSNILGRELYAVPKGISDVAPLRVDVFVPDQRKIPQALRDSLQTSTSVVLRHSPHIERLGLSRYVCQALDEHCRKDPTFWDRYGQLPFGSQLIFDSVVADLAQMNVTISPVYDLEKQTKPVTKLQQMWIEDVPIEWWPPAIDIHDLRLIRQIHDSISLVRAAKGLDFGARELIFKSSVSDMNVLYHELHFLLRNRPHPNILSRPLYVVTKKSAFGGKKGVYGFLVPYYSLGSLRDILAARRQYGELLYSTQLRWAKQITSALVCISGESESFYSDLRPDNVLLTDSDDALLIDFEQRGNWYEWCAPEVRYRMYVEHLRQDRSISSSKAKESDVDCVRELLQAWEEQGKHGESLEKSASAGLPMSQTSRNIPWFSLTPTAREWAMVYSLGLMLYCIFEGTCNPTISLTNAWPIEPHIEFPTFALTPEPVRRLIERCTAGATEWSWVETGFPKGIKRKGDKIVGSSGWSPDDAQYHERVLDEIREYWRQELVRATSFFKSKDWRCGRTGIKRPSLRAVLDTLRDLEEGE